MDFRVAHLPSQTRSLSWVAPNPRLLEFVGVRCGNFLLKIF